MRTLIIFLPLVLNAGCAKKSAPVETSESVTPAPVEQELVSADELFLRYIDVTGGEAAYQGVHNHSATGYMEVVAQGMKGTISMYTAEPNIRLEIMEIPGMGEIVSAFDGTHGWEINPIVGPRLIVGEELANERLDSTFNAPLAWKEMYPKRENQGAEEFAGQACWKVALETAVGNERTIFFDQESGLMHGVEMTMPSDMGPMPVSIRIEDYQEGNGILMPLRMIQSVGPVEVVVQIENIEFNVEDTPDLTMPESIKALLPSSDEAPPNNEEAPAAPDEATE